LWGLDAAGAAALAVATVVGGLFALLPKLRVRGAGRWPVLAAFGLAGAAAGCGLLLSLGTTGAAQLGAAGGAALVAAGVLAFDLEGTTPWYGSFINTMHNAAHVELVADRCTGVADCVQVCPRDVLQMNGPRRQVEITRPEQCIQCGACVVQCPEDALRFRYDDGSVVEAETIKSTRMNMVGRRTVRLPEGSEPS
jgi:NAD-dependent dihydropyrimidine dehydrogenase PreA subunit